MKKDMSGPVEICDGYKQFFAICGKEDFFNYGLENIKTIPIDKAKIEWKELRKRIHAKSNDLYIRNSGRNGSGNDVLTKLYKEVLGIEINFDQTNNNKPSSVLQELTGLKKNKTIFNYQVSHVFGNTKNVFCFTAPWNIVFIPKIMDPFTGHEAMGDYVVEFQKRFRAKIYKIFENEIEDYNGEITKHEKAISVWVSKNVPEKLRASIKKDFKTISNCS